MDSDGDGELKRDEMDWDRMGQNGMAEGQDDIGVRWD